MPSLSFQKQFVPAVRAMLDKDYAQRLKIKPKTTTIRAARKRPFRKGDTLYLFSGIRTKYCTNDLNLCLSASSLPTISS